MTDRPVNAETLAAALHDRYQSEYGGCDHWDDGVMAGSTPDCQEDAAAILAAIPPDPRLDALLVAARLALRVLAENGPDREEDALRAALAAFEEPNP